MMMMRLMDRTKNDNCDGCDERHGYHFVILISCSRNEGDCLLSLWFCVVSIYLVNGLVVEEETIN